MKGVDCVLAETLHERFVFDTLHQFLAYLLRTFVIEPSC